MGKTYIDTVKYLVKAGLEIDGIVEKPDIVGAVFGQTEGLLGDELDLRELQKNGRIGRIEVNVQVRGGKSSGEIIIPSSLDMVETSILAASLEIVDRVGPCDAKISVAKIEDSRNLKRKQLLERAKQLLKSMITTEIPESKELSEIVRQEVRVSDVRAYGEDRLPAGPQIESSDAITMVEGRADVINLLKNSLNNVVAIGGAKIGETIVRLCREKEVTVFLDGDRGGDIILRELLNAADVDYVARAPTGKEVEELTRKEIIKCLRQRIPAEQVPFYKEASANRLAAANEQQHVEAKPITPAPVIQIQQVVKTPLEPIPRTDYDDSESKEYKKLLKDLEGSLKARILSTDGKQVAEAPIREIMKTLSDVREAKAIILDGIITQRLIDLAEQKKIAYLVGIRAGNVSRRPATMKIILGE